MAASVSHMGLCVSDLDRSLRFYCDGLGCTIEKRQEGIGLIQLRAGTALIDLVPVDGKLGAAGGAPPGKDGRNLDHFCLRVEPFDESAIRTQLARYGYAAGPVEKLTMWTPETVPTVAVAKPVANGNGNGNGHAPAPAPEPAPAHEVPEPIWPVEDR